MELSELQKRILEESTGRSVVMAAAAAGKALSNDSILYTENGPITIGEVCIGNKIYGEDGLLHTVVGVYPQGKKQEYIVTFSDGTQIKCCEDHLWTFQTESLRSHHSKTTITCSLSDIIKNYPIFKSARAKNNFGGGDCKRINLFIPMTVPINFPEKDVLIDPYTMGALLGDGSFRTSTFTNEDSDIVNWVDEGLRSIGCCLDYINRYDYYINSNHTQTYSKILKQYGLWDTNSGNKFIPVDYKYNSVSNRLKLIQGLIDTDGSCEGRAYDIVLKSKQLILDLQEMCESLGLTATYSEKNAVCTNAKNGPKDCGTVYRLRIKTSKLIPKLHRSEKREKQWHPTNVYSHRGIVSIEPTDNYVEMTCITVDNPTQLFVTNHFIVTHNTKLLTEKVRQVLKATSDPSSIAVITFTNNAANELKERLGADYRPGLFIGTVHSLACQFLYQGGHSPQHLIENEKFDEIFEMIMTYPACIQHKDWIFLDEAQDSDRLQFDFIFNMIAPTHFFAVGDTRQAIYSFNGGDPKLLENLSQEPGVKTFSLNENYRNGSNILHFAKQFLTPLHITDDSIARQIYNGVVYERDFTPSTLISFLDKEVDYSNWAILTRTNAQADQISNILEWKGIPTISFKQKDLTTAELAAAMKSNAVKVLTMHASKGLEWDNVMVYGALYKSAEERRLCYVAATRAKQRLIWFNTSYPKMQPKRQISKKPTLAKAF